MEQHHRIPSSILENVGESTFMTKLESHRHKYWKSKMFLGFLLPSNVNWSQIVDGSCALQGALDEHREPVLVLQPQVAVERHQGPVLTRAATHGPHTSGTAGLALRP